MQPLQDKMYSELATAIFLIVVVTTVYVLAVRTTAPHHAEDDSAAILPMTAKCLNPSGGAAAIPDHRRKCKQV